MNVKLVYIVDGLEVVLEEKTLAKMDFFTFKNFDKEEDIIKSSLYEEKLNGFSKDGKVVLRYFPFDIPVQAIDFFGSLGGNPFSKNHELDVWYKNSGVSPSEEGIRSSVRSCLDTFEKVDSLREDCYEFFKPLDVVVYGYGAMVSDRDCCLDSIENVLDRECNNGDKHFFWRLTHKRAKEISLEKDSFKSKKM